MKRPYVICHMAPSLEKLAKNFRIKRLLLEGGGKINGSFLAADLIDELRKGNLVWLRYKVKHG